MFANLTGWHFLIVIAIVLLLFGATKLPALAKSMGQSMRIFRSEVKTMRTENDDAPAAPAAESEVPETAGKVSSQP